MQIEIVTASPTYGGGGTLALVGDFLLDGLPDVGGAIESVEVDLLLRSQPRAPRRRAVDDVTDEEFAALLDQLTDGEGIGPDHPEWDQRHEATRAKGPELRFRRTAGKVTLRIVSDLSELDVFGADEATPDTFAAAAREVVTGLADLPRRIKTGDDFDAPAFSAHLHSRLDVLPQTEQELDAVLAPLAEAARRRWESMSDWDVLDVDWTLFAPGTRERFDDPFFFDPADDEAPHGNDTGADVLAAYLTERPADGLAFLEAQVRDEGFDSLNEFVATDNWEHDAVVIATVFAELMVRGRTSAELTQLALQALDRRDAEAPSPRNALLRRALS